MKAAFLTLTIAALPAAALAQDAPADAAAAAPIMAHYSCAGGLELHVVFEDGKATVTPSGGTAVTLPQAMTADGFQYSDSAHSLRGRGDDATWTSGGTSVECSAGDGERG